MDVTTALRDLGRLFEEQDNKIGTLTADQAELRRQVATLERRAALAEESATALDEELLRISSAAREREATLTNEKKRLGDEVDRLQRQVNDAESRALLYERRSNELQEKADRHDRVVPACEKLLTQLDRLPLSMTNAAIVPGATRPEIELYGTYDWQHVMDAKLALMLAMRKED